MSADPRDDFSGFAGLEHMFFGIDDPLRMVRAEIEEELLEQVPSTRIEAIRCTTKPKFLTIGRRREDDPEKVRVSHFANCFRCTIDLATDTGPERLDATVTLCFGPDRTSKFLDVYEDAEPAFTDAAFQQRFLEFRDQDEG
jgi:hypothetical protein